MASKRTANSSSRGAEHQASSPEDSGSSKASSPAETPPARSQIDFQFLNFSHPADAKASRARRTVRSHVTKQQHQREHAAQAARRAEASVTAGGPTASSSTMIRAHTFPSDPTRQAPAAAPAALQSNDRAESRSESRTPSPTYAPRRRIDPGEVYPEAWHPCIPRTIEHYLNNMAVDIPNLDRSGVTALLRARLFPLIMTDAAPLHAVLLMAASQYERIYGPRSHTIDTLQLRGMTIRSINSALEDSVRATSDHVIVAVAQMATYEALYGSRETFSTHMSGLTRMVTLRGGLPALGLDGLVERVLLWTDANAAHITRSQLYFDRAAFPTRAVHPRPDPARFAGGVPRERES